MRLGANSEAFFSVLHLRLTLVSIEPANECDLRRPGAVDELVGFP
jgi:hypothetical protein